MDPRFDNQERELDRRLAELADRLDVPAPRPECLASIKANMDGEVRRMQHREIRLSAWRPWLGAAAALLLTVGLSLPLGSKSAPRVILRDNPEIAFAGMLEALGESETRFALLFEESMCFEGSGSYSDPGSEVVDPFESLEDTLESFEYIMGA